MTGFMVWRTRLPGWRQSTWSSSEVPVGHAVVKQDAGVAGDEAGTPSALDALQLANALPHRSTTAKQVVSSSAPPTPVVASVRGVCPPLLMTPGVTGSHVGCGTLGVDQLGAFLAYSLERRPATGMSRYSGRRRRPRGRRRPASWPRPSSGWPRGSAAHGPEVELLHHVQFLEQDMAAGVGRRFIYGVAVVGGGDGLLPAAIGVGKVLHGEQAPCPR